MIEPSALLVVAVSARALAASARRAGFAAVAIDAFGDTDTRAVCRAMRVVENAVGGFAEVDLEPVVAHLCAAHAPAGVVYGSGFDDCPEKLMALGRHAPLLGCPPLALARAKTPGEFADACAAAGIPHPEIRFAAPEDPSRWLIKRRGGSGGLHISPGTSRPLGKDEYWQRRIAGRPISLLFVRDSATLTPIAWSEQWSSPSASAPFRYGGAAGPLDVAPPRGLMSGLFALTGALGLRGLCSADFLDDGARFWLLEINPRPGATLDLFDDDDDPMLKRHIDALADRPSAPPTRRKPGAAQIVYAETDAVAPHGEWSPWAADRPAPGTPVPAGSPFCTVSARGPNVAEAKAKAQERTVRIKTWLQQEAS